MTRRINWFFLASPASFFAVAGRLTPWFAGASVLLLAAGLYVGFGIAPDDYQQGSVYRIIYIHVPAAWMSMFIYLLMAGYGVLALTFNTRLSAMMVLALAPTGAWFTVIALITGSIWGRPTWGTYWVWDARLTSMLVLLFLYLGYLALSAAESDRPEARGAAILSLVGTINLPIIKYSVEWWNTLHQGASITLTKSAIDPAMLLPLFLSLGGFTCMFGGIVLMRMRTELATTRVRVRNRRMAEAHA